MTRTRPFAAAAALTAALALTGCGDDSSPQTTTKPSSTTNEAAPQNDGRELADWAAVTFLSKDSTAICDAGSPSLAERFAKDGWCDNAVDFKETPVSLDLVGTCDATAAGGKTAPGTLYAYHVSPSILFTEDDGTEGGIVVIVDKQSDEWIVNDLYTTSLDPEEPVVGSCPYQGLKLLNESISME